MVECEIHGISESCPVCEVESLKSKTAQLQARLSLAEKVIQDTADILRGGDTASIWAGSGTHNQIELFLNPVIVESN